MHNRTRTTISILLALGLTLQLLTGCSKITFNTTSSENEEVVASILSEGNIIEQFVDEHFSEEEYVSETFVSENMTYEDGVYECIIDENTVCETYIFETVINDNSISEIKSQLPAHFDEYDIDWKKVIGKFIVGTAIIIAVGVVDYASKGSAKFIFGTTLTVSKDAFATAATFSALNVVLESAGDGEISKKAKKYAIEGFADGFMWGAIGSVLKIPVKNLAMKGKLTLSSGELLTVKANSQVVSESGSILGYIRYGKNEAYLVEGTYAAAKVIKVFAKNGKELTKTAGYAKNVIIEASGELLYTDANGKIFREGRKLLPKIKYLFNGYKYETDKLGRIKSAEGKLQLKSGSRIMDGTVREISNGYEKPGDERGHLIAHMFGGPDEIGNLVAMGRKTNHGKYQELEKLWQSSLKEGKEVRVKIKVKYKEKSGRPQKFKVNYWIDGKKYTKTIKNI